jgi:tetratricopeptide (TPR) repeat protein
MAAMPMAGARFVGRDRELAILVEAVDAVRRGRGGLYLVGGEPGIGKTSLVDELSRRAAGGGVHVLWGRCHEIEGGPPYWPWIQVIQAQVRASAPERVAARLDPGAAPLGLLVPELRPLLDARDAVAGVVTESDTARFRLFQAMADFLRQVAGDAPCLLVLDDLHWADLPSLLLLEFLAGDLAEMPLLVVGTFREVESRRDALVDAALGRMARQAAQLSLEGFDLDEASRFIELASGEAVPPALAQRLRDETAGNPFFLDELVRLFRGRGDWSLGGSSALPISQGVRGAIRQRVAPLDAATRHLLSAAAVAGREFDLLLLEAATGTRRAQLLETLAPAVELELVAAIAGRPGQYRFPHALLRETIYDEVPAATRTELHRRYAEALERRGGALDGRFAEIAHHYFEASAEGGEAKAIEYALRAGHEALQSLAYEAAAQQFQRALHLTDLGVDPDPRRPCEILLALGEAKSRAGVAEEAAQVFRRAVALARRAASPELLARAAIGLGDIGTAWTEIGRSDGALVRLLREALEQLGDGGGVLRAAVLARLATEVCWTAPPDEIEALSEQAVGIAREANDRGRLAYALVGRIHCLGDPARVEERLRLASEVIALTDDRGDLAASAQLWRLGDALQLGRMSDVQVYRGTLLRTLREARQPGHLWIVPAVHAQQALLEGRLDEAQQYLAAILEPGPGWSNAEQAGSALAFLIQRERGHHGELAAGLKALVSQFPALGVWRAALAMLLAENGELDDARRELATLVDDGVLSLRLDVTWLSSVAMVSEACRVCGTAEQAATIHAALLPYAERNIVAGPLYFMGPVSYYLGVVAVVMGRRDLARDHLERALEAVRETGARPWIARILLAQAALLEADGSDPVRVAEQRREAAALAQACGIALGGAAPAGAAVDPGVPATATAVRAERTVTLRHEGDVWTLAHGDNTVRVKDVRGLHYLARLLAEPGREFHVLDLAGAASAGSPVRDPAVASADLGSLLDGRAKRDLRARLEELREREESAERNDDLAAAEQARLEIETIAGELARAVGLGGRDRKAGAIAERARASVTKATRAAIRLIASRDEMLGSVLSHAIRTGAYCSYEPIAGTALAWHVELPPAAARSRQGG